MQNQNLANLIQDFFEITGRPCATLTVEEYAKFLEIEKNLAGNHANTEIKVNHSVMTTKENNNSGNENFNPHITYESEKNEENKENNIRKIPVSKSKIDKTTEIQNTGSENKKMDDILNFMKSVSS